MRYDVIVIGGGHNGLTTAALLGNAGRKVLLLERRSVLGGLAALEEFHPGFRTPGVLHDTSGIRRGVADALRLEVHGLKWRAEEVPVFTPQEERSGLLLYRSAERAGVEIRGHSPRDAERYAAWRGFIERIRPMVSRLQNEPAPALGAKSAGDWWDLVRMGLAFKRLAPADLHDFLRIGPMCIADWLNEWFETQVLKAALAGPAIAGTWMGPWSAGTVVTLLLQECAAGREVEGGPAALTRALESACRSNGVEIRLSRPVRRIRLEGGRAKGVDFSDGGAEDAPVVVSSCDPRTTFLNLLDPMDLPSGLETEIGHWRCRGTTGRVSLALTGPLEFAARIGGRFEAARIGEKLDDLEKAFDAVKYGEFSKSPHLEVRVPTVSDPTLAPSGHHVVSILAHFAPYELRGGWDEGRRQAFGEVVVARLARFAPGLPDRIAAAEVMTPADLEDRYGLCGGQIHHGEQGLDQLFSLRPASSCSRHGTPIPGLYLCGSGTHPGGGITCAPASLAAAAILRGR